ncbi:fatty acid desaturase [Plantactinospora sp. BC1]|uniref:fatty acid desaturase family protein n=1 Tax=Plantactinospora sp. BC1 TaxID=2108470 RepID=UPI000D166E70|nr:fatty acid desaturase [Plantactinospora sp. BC1]AVT28454.1 fatty acid desaturase [Plantactinospora sp. BC1]
MTVTSTIPLRDDQLERLDAAENALLAPVRGEDARRALSREYFVKKPGRFVTKFVFAFALIVAGWVAVALVQHWAVTVAAVLVLGLMYAHLVELQHECLHEHAFQRRIWNRICGVLCGLFMLSSFWHYKHDHLRHHAFLGTPQNQEFFNYRFRNLDRWYGLGFALAALHPGRYWTTLRDIVRSCLGRPIPGIDRARDLRRIQYEYRLMAVLLVAAVVATVVTGSPYLLLVWLLPAMLVAEPAHYLIEMPEHFGLNTQSDDNVLTNTRTIRASKFAQWYTNYNNLHTAHHYHQGVPMAQAPSLHALIEPRVVPVESSYWHFYRLVITGRITSVRADETCMTR